MPGIQFPSMARSPSKRVSQVLLATQNSISTLAKTQSSEEQGHTEKILVDSQVSISSELMQNTCSTKETGIVLDTDNDCLNPDEYHSCPEDLTPEKVLVEETVTTPSKTDDQNTEVEPIINHKDVSLLFEMIGELTESMKSITTTTAIIPSLQTEIKSMATQLSTIRNNVETQISEMNARVLVNEEEIKTIKQDLLCDKTYLSSHIKPAVKKLEKGGLLDCLSTDLLKKIQMNEKAVADLKTVVDDINNSEMDRTINYDLSDRDMHVIADYIRTQEIDNFTVGFEESLKKVEDKVNNLLNTNRDAMSERFRQLELQIKDMKPESKKSQNEKQPAINQTLEHEVVIIGDSNTTNIDMSDVGRNTKRKRFTCYTIPQTKEFLNTADIKVQPKKVMLHLGTNDVVDTDVETLKQEYHELTVLARSKFPQARIYISSIFNRKSKTDDLNVPIGILNQHLEEFCDTTARFTFIDNSNILHKDMRDAKHVNRTGLDTFIWNIRITVFGESFNSSKRRGR